MRVAPSPPAAVTARHRTVAKVHRGEVKLAYYDNAGQSRSRATAIGTDGQRLEPAITWRMGDLFAL